MANPSGLSQIDSHRTIDFATPGDAENFSYDDEVVRMFVTATIVWGLVTTIAGLIAATLLVLPWLSDDVPWFAFGRLRPLYSDAAIFAFVGNGMFAAVYYSTQRLCKSRMWSDALSRVHFWGWQAILVAGAITLPFGYTQGRGLAETEWPIDVMVTLIWLFVFGGNFLMTLLRRREQRMYVSLWFYIATIVTFSLIHVFNNFVVPTGWFTSVCIAAGVQDAFVQCWYRHSVESFFLTMPFLGLMYYFLPKAAAQPVFSYRLCIIQFWSLVFLSVLAVSQHAHYTALPEWASTMGMLFGLMMWMPSWAGVFNGMMTWRCAGQKVASEPVLKFFAAGLIFYGFNAFVAALLSIKSINALTQYTDTDVANFNSGVLGWNGLMLLGMIYWLLPKLYQTRIWSPILVHLHFWTGLLGVLLYLIPTYAAGFMESVMWHAIDETGNLTYPDFLDAVRDVQPFRWLQLVGIVIYFIGMLMLAINAVMTWMKRPERYETTVHNPLKISSHVEDDSPTVSMLSQAPVLEFGKKVDTFWQLNWHREWERLPVKFTCLVAVVVSIASMFEIVPMFLIGNNSPAIATVIPYSPLELAGRRIFISEGCCNCHTQMVRPIVSETKRYGEYSKPGEFVFDRPAQWGDRRIGRDLAREGGKQTNFWHWNHFDDPRTVSPGSVMPSFRHFLDRDLDFSSIAAQVHTESLLGAAYSDEELNNTEAVARRQAEVVAADMVQQGGPAAMQDKQAMALIAYLQRLGTDLFRSEEPVASPEQPNSIVVEDSEIADEKE